MTHAYAGANGTVAFLAGKESYETAFASVPPTATAPCGRVGAALLRTRVRRIPLRELWECQSKQNSQKCLSPRIISTAYNENWRFYDLQS